MPADDTVFHFIPEYPTWVTVDAEFRDRLGKCWPSFLYGKPVKGTFAYRDKRGQADFTVACASACQPGGDQHRRVLGDLFLEEKGPPQLNFVLESLGEPKSADLAVFDKTGKKSTQTVRYCDGKAVLEIAGKTIDVTPRVTYGFGGAKDGPVTRVRLTAWLTLKAADLGLHTPGPETEIDVRINMSGSTKTKATPKPKK